MAETHKSETHKSEAGNGEVSKTTTTKTETTHSETTTSDAAGMKDGKKPGPKDSPVQVRNAGEEAQADEPKDWDKQDDAVDESFPASDSSAKY